MDIEALETRVAALEQEIAEIKEMARGLKGDPGRDGRDGRDGKSVDARQILAVVSRAQARGGSSMIFVPPANISIMPAEVKAPDVHVAAPNVTVEAPQVNAPVTVNVPTSPERRVRFTEDGKGNITEATLTNG